MGSSVSLGANTFQPLVGEQSVIISIPFLGYDIEDGDEEGFLLRLLDVGKPVETFYNFQTARSVKYKNLTFYSFFYGGNAKELRMLFRHFVDGCRGLVFVLNCDSKSSSELKSHLHDAKDMFYDFFSLIKPSCDFILVLSNSRSLPFSESADKIEDMLGLEKLRAKKWRVQETCFSSGKGIREGMEWLVANIASDLMAERKQTRADE